MKPVQNYASRHELHYSLIILSQTRQSPKPLNPKPVEPISDKL